MKYILETKRLLLREMVDDDFNSLAKVLSTDDKEYVLKWLNWCKSSYQKDGFGHYAVIYKETGEMIGSCGISMQPINHEWKPEIGYHIRKDYHRQGLAKEVSSALRDYFFTTFKYDEVFSYMHDDNVASFKTAESMGMKYRFSYVDKEEKYLVYSMTKKEWMSIS